MSTRVWCRVCGKQLGSRPRPEDGTVWAGMLQPNAHFGADNTICTGTSVPAALTLGDLDQGVRRRASAK